MRGIVKWFSREKGYGFIKAYDGEEVFVHLKEIEKSGLWLLDEGQRVEFQIRENRKGKFAIQLINLWPI